jgi:phage minor structural protein
VYQVSIFNGGQETVIHYPTAEKEAPHILSAQFKETLSQAEQLTLSIPYGNPGYNLIQGLKTKVRIYDTRDNSVIFSGRVIPTKDGMSSDGKFTNQVACEGAMNYLVDSQTRRWEFINKNPREILQFLLDMHNEKVDSERKIYLGIVEVTQPITISTNYESTLNAIVTKVRNILGGDLRVQERNGLLYLDYLIAQGNNNEVEIRLGYNAKEFIREYDPTDIISRGIVLGYGEGVNQLDITKVNGGLEYIDNPEAIEKYGIIEGLITNKDIQNADTLKLYGQTVLNEKKQPKLSYSQSSLDLSVLTGHENEKYELGDTLHTIIDFMSVDVYGRVVERERDLINYPWDPKLTISTRPITLTDQIIQLKQRNLTLENAPQGSTCIFPLIKAENTDPTLPIEFDLDIPKECININRVYINLHGRKYRAYEKGIIGGSSTKSVTGGGGYQDGSVLENTTVEPTWTSSTLSTQNAYAVDFGADGKTHQHNISKNMLQHTHMFGIKLSNHTHDISHTHANTLEFDIYESTYPKNVKVKVNGTDIGVNFGDGNSAFDQYDIDITDKVVVGNNKIEISTERNGRIDAIVYSQIFIQSK